MCHFTFHWKSRQILLKKPSAKKLAPNEGRSENVVPQMKADQKMLCPKWKQIVSDVSPLIVAQLQLWFYTWKGADAFQQFLGIDLICPVILVKLL